MRERLFACRVVRVRLSPSVAAFGMQLRKSQHDGEMSIGGVLEIARANQGKDPHGYRREFVSLVERAQPLVR